MARGPFSLHTRVDRTLGPRLTRYKWLATLTKPGIEPQRGHLSTSYSWRTDPSDRITLMTYEPPDCATLMARVPPDCDTLLAYWTRHECPDLPQGTTWGTAPSPRLWKPRVGVARMMAPGTIVAPAVNTWQPGSPGPHKYVWTHPR
jgi:hypothetical protein